MMARKSIASTTVTVTLDLLMTPTHILLRAPMAHACSEIRYD
jgi:hypothetical protein